MITPMPTPDTTSPTTTITSSVSGNTITWTLTFNEELQNDVAARHITLSSGMLGTINTVSSAGISTTTITSTHTTDATVTLFFNGMAGSGNNAADAAGRTGSGSTRTIFGMVGGTPAN